MKSYTGCLIAVTLFVLLTGEVKTTNQSKLVKHILRSTQQQYAPDSRTAVFDISYKQTNMGMIIIGEVDNLATKNAVIEALRKNLKGEVFDSIRVLPDSLLGNNKSGIVIVTIGDVRRKPNKQGELVTQVLMGTVVKLLKKVKGYYYIQMPDQYLGWIDATSMYITDQASVDKWNNAHKVIIKEFNCVVREKPDSSSAPVCDAVAGCVLISVGLEEGWESIELADGQKGFVPDSLVQDLDAWNKSRMLTGENLEKTAKALLGSPYLWGGTSVKGMDCSGFVKTVFRLNGMELNRDANQQAEQGMHVDPGKNFQNLQKGDLIFFGQKATTKQPERITHVGLYINNKLFIHSSGRVKLSSFDPASKYFKESLLKRFIRARRIIRE